MDNGMEPKKEISEALSTWERGGSLSLIPVECFGNIISIQNSKEIGIYH